MKTPQVNINDLQSWNFEIYTCNPETKETGWDIAHIVAFGLTKADAIEWI